MRYIEVTNIIDTITIASVVVNYYYYYYYYLVITFMQGFNTYIPETNHVSMVHSVAAIL